MPVLSDEDVGISSRVLSDEAVGLAPASPVEHNPYLLGGLSSVQGATPEILPEANKPQTELSSSEKTRLLLSIERPSVPTEEQFPTTPKLDPNDLSRLGMHPTLAKVVAGTQQAVSGLVDFFLTPEGISTGIFGSVPAMSKPIAQSFLASMAAESPGQVIRAYDAAQKGDYTTVARELTGLTMASGMIAGSLAKPKSPVVERAAEVGPATEQAVKQLEGEQNAIPIKSTNEEMLRAQGEGPGQELGLREVGKGNKPSEIPAPAQEEIVPEQNTPEQMAARAEEAQKGINEKTQEIQKEDVLNQPKEPAVSEQAPPQAEAPKAIGEVSKPGPGDTGPATPVTEPVTEGGKSQQLGIVPPGFGFVSAAGQKLAKAWEGLKTAWKTGPNKQAMAANMDAAESNAMIGGEHMGNRVKLMVPNELDRKAITFIIEANDNPAQLGTFLSKTIGKNLEATKAIQHAISNWNRLNPVANKVSNIMDAQRDFEQAHGVDTDNIDGYIKHAYDMDLLMGKGRPVVLSGSGGTGLSTAFKKQRSFPTYADAIEAGFTPKTLDSSALVASRVAAGTKLVNRIKWGDALRGITDPTSHNPIVTSLVTQPKGTKVAPAGYTVNEVIPGVSVAVHQGYEKMFDAITGGSRIGELEASGIPVGELALKTGGAIKHGLLAFDTFHASRIMQKQLFLTGKIGFKKGKTLLDYSDKDLAEAVKQDLITPEMADYARVNRPDAELLIQKGLNVGRVQEALYAATVQNLPIIGRFNKWVFDKLTRGAMLESGIIELNRTANANPTIPRDQIARTVAKDLNSYFGNLGRQGVFKSKTFQDAARLVFLAPQWVESMARTEAGALKQGTYDFARTGQIGTLAKGVGNGLIAYFIGTQLLNLATRKQFTWQNQEKDHKLDAWVPDVTSKSPGYFVSPFSVAAELTHDFIRYSARKPDSAAVVSKIASNKLSPFGRAIDVFATGEDYSGTKIYGTWNKVKASAWALAPTPIPLSAAIKGTDYPGQTQRQLLGSAGLKVEPAPKKEIPFIVEQLKITSREGLEGYLNSVAKDAKKLPTAERVAYVQKRFIEDGLSPRYRKESLRKMAFKVRD